MAIKSQAQKRRIRRMLLEGKIKKEDLHRDDIAALDDDSLPERVSSKIGKVKVI